MATRTDIQDVVFDWFEAATGIDPQHLVWADQPDGDESGESAPQPELPYVTLKLIVGPLQVGNSDAVIMPAAGSKSTTPIVSGQRNLTLSVNGYGVGSDQFLDDAVRAIEKPSNRGDASRLGDGLFKIATLVDDIDYTIWIDGEPIVVHSGIPANATVLREAFVSAIPLALPLFTTANGPGADDFQVIGPHGLDWSVELDGNMAEISFVRGVDLVFVSGDGTNDAAEILDDAFFENRFHTDFFLHLEDRYPDPDTTVIDSFEGTGAVENLIENTFPLET